MALRRHKNWNALVGVDVEIRQHGQRVRMGRVDDVLADSSILWLAANGGLPRTMFAAADGYEVWVDRQQLFGPEGFGMTTVLPYPLP